MKRGFALTVGVVGLAVSSCPDSAKLPGKEEIGTFQFEAVRLDSASTCQGFKEMPDGGFRFVAAFSHDPGGAAYYTVNGVSVNAEFDGQLIQARQSADRRFEACPCKVEGKSVRLNEDIRVALLSKSQAEALGGSCPTNPLDGGVPRGDGGISPPGSTSSGFDAVLACGLLVDTLDPDPPVTDGGAVVAACECSSCAEVYTVVGTRQ